MLLERPFRSPHHTISCAALVGGGANAQPGEISLAHNGILYLDEVAEFPHSVLEVLRGPLEDRSIHISRIKYNVVYPASFMLVASMNPCPCGYYTHPTRPCTCRPDAISRYLNRISGPLMDRFDIQCEILPVQFHEISKRAAGEGSPTIRERVIRARAIQQERFASVTGNGTSAQTESGGIFCNAQMTDKMIRKYAGPDQEGIEMLRTAMARLNLSARAYNRILKVARTIADLDGSEQVRASHLAEAIGYRSLDRADWTSR